MAQKLNNFEKFKEKTPQISALFSKQTPPNDWPDAIDHLIIGLVANKYSKHGKTSENLILSPEIYIQSAPNNSNENYTFMGLGRAGRFGQS